MTVQDPNFLQVKSYAASKVRMMMEGLGIPSEGIVDVGDLAVTPGAGMNVSVAAGECFVQGDVVARQGLYHVVNDAAVTVAIAAAHATLPRIDQIVCRVRDSTVGDGADSGALEVVTGTATSGATLANLTGAAALPSSAVRLAYVLVPAAAASILAANIGNLKRRDGSGGAITGIAPSYAWARPKSVHPGAFAWVNAQSIPAGNAVFNGANEDIDTMAMHAAGSFTCPIAGFYDLACNVLWAAAPAAANRIELLVDGGGLEVVNGPQEVGTPKAINFYFTRLLLAGAVVNFRIWNGSAGAINANINASVTYKGNERA